MGRNNYRKNSDKRDFSDQIFDLVMNSVDQMDFSSLSDQIRGTIKGTREEFLRQLSYIQNSYNSNRHYRSRTGQNFRKDYQARPDRQRYRKNPHTEIVVSERKLPGTWSGPLAIAAGGTGLAIFGGLSLGFGLAGAAFGSAIGSLAATSIVIESISLPLTAISGFLLGRGIFLRNRVRRLKEYMKQWKDRSYIMLSDLAAGSGQSLTQIRKDIGYLLDKSLVPGARMDQEETCLLLTDESIKQYEAAKESQRLREEEERRQQEEEARLAGSSREEKDIHSFILQTNEVMQDIKKYRDSLTSDSIQARLNRLELVLARIFVCVKEHPEKLRLTRRLMNYYIPSVMKLLGVYEDLEKQPIQGENILKTRRDIESSLDTLNDALETMFDELFQEEALDVSADIQVLKSMLIQDGFSPSGDELKTQ